MLLFLARRAALAGVVALGALAIVFVMTHMIPGDPARAALGLDASQDQVEQYRRELGLDRPLVVQFVRYVARVASGDFGRSIVTKNPVVEDLSNAIPATVELLAPSLVLSLVLGVVLGVVSASSRGRFADHCSRVVSILGMSLPVFWFGLVLQVIFYGKLSWLPASGRLPLSALPPARITGLYTIDALVAGDWTTFLQVIRYLILPVITLSFVNIATIARFNRATLLEAFRQDYVRTARAKGLGERAVIYKHALRNALIPVLTVFGIRAGSMFGGAVLTESIFAWPGVGRYAVFALQRLDVPVVSAFTIYMTVTYAILNTLVDISYSFLDPRIR
jgi:peptide/nickel transport system permease protein